MKKNVKDIKSFQMTFDVVEQFRAENPQNASVFYLA